MCTNESSQKHGDEIFDEEPVVVANSHRGEVDCILVAENKGDQKSDKVTQKIHLSVVATSTGRPRYSETRSTMSLSVRAVNTENIRNHIDLGMVIKHL